MSTVYTIEYKISMSLLQRAMTSWAKPQRPLWIRGLRLAGLVAIGGVVGAVLAFAGAFNALPEHFLTGVLVGFYIGLLFWLVMHRIGIKKLSGFTSALLHRQGPTLAVFSADHVEMSNQTGQAKMEWRAYDQVIRMRDATALKSGAMVYPIPHSALPEGVSADAFHADLSRWQAEAQ
jgi:hypothetical protein